MIFKDKKFDIDNEGFLLDTSQFCEEWLECHNKNLSEQQKNIINIVRNYYLKNKSVITCNTILKMTGLSRRQLSNLFKYSDLCKLAGLPKPRG